MTQQFSSNFKYDSVMIAMRMTTLEKKTPIPPASPILGSLSIKSLPSLIQAKKSSSKSKNLPSTFQFQPSCQKSIPSTVTRVPVTGASMVLDTDGALVHTLEPERVFGMRRIVLHTNLEVKLVVLVAISAEDDGNLLSRDVTQFRIQSGVLFQP